MNSSLLYPLICFLISLKNMFCFLQNLKTSSTWNIFGACNNTEGLLLNLRRELQELGCHQQDETKRLQWHPLVPVPKLLKLLSLPPDLAD